MKSIELLSPAKNLSVGIAAINHGADAVYIGAPDFSARATAGNSLEDIESLVNYAHLFQAKVYVALNTILFDNELERAVELVHKLYEIHVDALIVQDLGLLEYELPPIPLHASTQLNNRTPEKVEFLEQVGFSQVVLARELNLKQISQIAEKTNVSLEFFVHGALCVCYSGQCYMSEYATKRSGNRGECSQMCRHKYSLQGLKKEYEGYLISTKDLSLGDKLEDLISAGITSFKIEGRLKDEDYVKNVTTYFRKKLDAIISKNLDLQRSSRGVESFNFSPDIYKTFNRGFTSYYIDKQRNDIANIYSPKSIGEFVGKIVSAKGNNLQIDTKLSLCNGDGLCFVDKDGEMAGIQVNNVDGRKIKINKNVQLLAGTDIWRNYSVAFKKELEQSGQCRKLPIEVCFKSLDGLNYVLTLSDEIGNSVEVEGCATESASNTERMKSLVCSQMAKMGESIFSLRNIEIEGDKLPFVSVAKLNELRRTVCNALNSKIIDSYTVSERKIEKKTNPYPKSEPLDYRLNIANKSAENFFRRHGVEVIQPAFEVEHRNNVPLMTTKYCIRYQLHECAKGNASPIFLTDKSHKYRVEFDCEKCEMNIYSADNETTVK